MIRIKKVRDENKGVHADLDGDGECDACAKAKEDAKSGLSFIDRIISFFRRIINWFKNLFY